MCGIYGVVDPKSPVDLGFLQKQRDTISHRGPDDAGLWISPSRNVGLAHCRLAIIDLSASGHQPMVSQDGRYAIVFNGEVYNFRELRSELQGLGHSFRGGSDTEVVLAAYKAWGEDCVSRFNGMFALALYDRGNDTISSSLFLARDRVGKKPFYYLHNMDCFQFASELKAISSQTTIDTVALNYYLALGYVPADLCLALGVKKLPPAHTARLDLRTFRLTLRRYWQLPNNCAESGIDGEELADQAETLLHEAVRLRLISDVPFGVLLSGGLDSSLVVAAAAHHLSKPVKTFTISVPGSQYDEGVYAQCVADYFATDHHVLQVEQPSLHTLEELIPFVDEPIADSSLIPSFIVSKLTRQHVTVALGGDGGDELFGGYSDYPTSLADERRFRWIPALIMKTVGILASGLPAGVKGRNRLASLQGGPLQKMIWGSSYFDAALRLRIFTRDQVETLGQDLDEPERWLLSLYRQGCDPVDCMTRTHFGSILPDDFLVKVDRTSMYNSLEMRAPFLDYRLIEFAFSQIPSKWKVWRTETRRVQKKLADRLLPPELDTNRKQGFSIPMDDWLREDKCQIVREHLPYLPEVIKKSSVEDLINGQMRGRANGARLFALLMLTIAMKNNGWR